MKLRLIGQLVGLGAALVLVALTAGSSGQVHAKTKIDGMDHAYLMFQVVDKNGKPLEGNALIVLWGFRWIEGDCYLWERDFASCVETAVRYPKEQPGSAWWGAWTGEKGLAGFLIQFHDLIFLDGVHAIVFVPDACRRAFSVFVEVGAEPEDIPPMIGGDEYGNIRVKGTVKVDLNFKAFVGLLGIPMDLQDAIEEAFKNLFKQMTNIGVELPPFSVNLITNYVFARIQCLDK
jgi:hypothetical protein